MNGREKVFIFETDIQESDRILSPVQSKKIIIRWMRQTWRKSVSRQIS